jgi:predicted HTH transcriptional regulator
MIMGSLNATVPVNLHTGQADPKMEHVIVKTVCDLLNHEGGTLLIGVADDGTVPGIGPDLKTLGTKRNADGYELHLRQVLDASPSAVTAQTVRIRFSDELGPVICLVTAAAAADPVFARPAKGTDSAEWEFWVRVGNATKKLQGNAMLEYQRQHWDS